MKLNYWNPDHLQDIAWEALAYHETGTDFAVTADAALSVAEELEGVGFCSRYARAQALQICARYMAVYEAEWTARRAA
jgi:hypothetical protein